MQKRSLTLAGICVLGLLLAAASHAAPQNATFIGTWEMSMANGGAGGGGGGGGGHRSGGGGTQTLSIAQDGEKFKVTHKTRRGENTYDATVSGNAISWTEQRQGRDGNTMTIDFKATLEGDTLTGSTSGGQFNREFTAKRSN
ncbi:MAG: hypothetical protein WA192_05545 [Candidatus Acidiferrales bacterium]